MKNGDSNFRYRQGAEGRKGLPFRETFIGLVSASVFVVLFYLLGQEMFPGTTGRHGGIFPFVGAVALTLAVALFLTEWFGFARREVSKVRLAARDFVFLCSLSLILLFLAKGVVDPSSVPPSAGRFPRAYTYLILWLSP